MPDIVSVGAVSDDAGHYAFPGDHLTFCGLPVAIALSVGLRRRFHRDNPCQACYDPDAIRQAAALRTAAVTPTTPPPVTEVLYPPTTDPDHPMRPVWDLCERLDAAHATAVRPRPQEAP